ncbi:MAG: hypothetical protein M1818_001809 [Claussenomyces sp. TS43310]|nr:MAG: hypothetical protein M1818_001809 [Claussenomyces sp. TS43310]
MASSLPLFTIPIPPSSSSSGSITCTTPAPRVYLLTFSSPPDNRLTTSFCAALLLALDALEFSQHPPGILITTSGLAKFYSNGLDLEHATTTPGFWTDSLYAVFRRLATYPMPTLALINGHAFAGGLMLAMYHDYRLFNPTRGFLCLNELDFGYALKPAMSSIFRQKLADPAVYRALVLEARRFAAPEALRGGLVDALGALPEALALIADRKLSDKAASGIYGLMRAEMLRETLALLDGHEREEKRDAAIKGAEDRRREEGSRRVAKWNGEAARGKAKL